MSSNALKLTVIGTGYLGATHAACMAELGFEVLGVDTDQGKIDKLSAGQLPFFEPELTELLVRNLESGRLRFTTSFREAGEFGNTHFLCVGTPQRQGTNAADMSYLDSAVSSLLPHLRHDSLLVGKSTVPVGTAERLAGMVSSCAPAGVDVEVAWNPEFLREGFAVADTLHPDRLVFGVGSARAEEWLRKVYAPVLALDVPVVVTDVATAQLVKVAANAFLATKISFINAMAEVCEVADADILHLAEALGADGRIGPQFLRPGLGFGGGCLPKDIRAFMARADELGVGEAVSFLGDVDRINIRRRSRVVAMAEEMLSSVRGARIAALGAAFKPNSDDIRDSPALAVSSELHRRGADVVVFDPAAGERAAAAAPGLVHATTLADAVHGADLVMVLTEWQMFREMDPRVLGSSVRHRRVIDARHALAPARWTAAGWDYGAPGRPGIMLGEATTRSVPEPAVRRSRAQHSRHARQALWRTQAAAVDALAAEDVS